MTIQYLYIPLHTLLLIKIIYAWIHEFNTEAILTHNITSVLQCWLTKNGFISGLIFGNWVDLTTVLVNTAHAGWDWWHKTFRRPLWKKKRKQKQKNILPGCLPVGLMKVGHAIPGQSRPVETTEEGIVLDLIPSQINYAVRRNQKLIWLKFEEAPKNKLSLIQFALFHITVGHKPQRDLLFFTAWNWSPEDLISFSIGVI